MQETNIHNNKNNNNMNPAGRHSLSARSPIHGRMSEDYNYRQSDTAVSSGVRTPATGSMNSAYGNINGNPNPMKNHGGNSPINIHRQTLAHSSSADGSGSDGEYFDSNQITDIVDDDDNVAQEEVKNFINRRLLYKQHLVLMLEIYPDGNYEYKEMSLRDLFDRINHHTMLIDAKLDVFDQKNKDKNEGADSREAFMDGTRRPRSSPHRGRSDRYTSSNKHYRKKFYQNVDSTISALRHRDLRRLEYSYKPVEEPAILIRRHVTLISLDPIRAAVMNDRMIMIVPQGADTLIEMLLQHLQYWAVDDDATNALGPRTNGSTFGTNIDDIGNSIGNGYHDSEHEDEVNRDTADNSRSKVPSPLAIDGNDTNMGTKSSKPSSMEDGFDTDHAKLFDATRVGHSFSEINRDADAAKKKKKSSVMGAITGMTGLFDGKDDNNEDEAKSITDLRMTEDKMIAAAENAPKLLFRRASTTTTNSTGKATGGSMEGIMHSESSVSKVSVGNNDDEAPGTDGGDGGDFYDNRDNEGLVSDLPFEARCYEAILATVVCVQSDELSNDATLAAQIHKDLRNATIVTMTMQEHMRILKNRLSKLISTVAGDKAVIERIIDNDDYLCYLNLSDLADDPKSYNNYDGPKGKIVKHREDMEALFESYFIDFTTLHSKISYIKSQLQTAEELMSLRLDTSRNQLLIADTTVSIVSMGLGLGAYIVGMFGMNLKSDVEEQNYWFMVVSVMTVFGIFGLAGGTIAYLKKKKILPHTRNNRNLKKYMKKRTLKPKLHQGFIRESLSFNMPVTA